MKTMLVTCGRYAGQLLKLDDGIAAIAVSDNWGIDKSSGPYPFDTSPAAAKAPEPASLIAYEQAIDNGKAGDTPIAPAAIVSISAATPAVVTVSSADAPKLVGATSVQITGTGSVKFDKTFTNITVGGSPPGTTITLVGVNNTAGPAIANKGTITKV